MNLKVTEFYISRSNHFRLGRILGDFFGWVTLLLTNLQKYKLFWYYKRPQKWGEELYWCFVVLKWVNYKNVLHRKMCNLGHTLSHVWLQHRLVSHARFIRTWLLEPRKYQKNVLLPRLCNINLFLKYTYFRTKMFFGTETPKD